MISLILVGLAVATTLLAAGIGAARYRGGAAVTAGGSLAGLALSLYLLYLAFSRGVVYESFGPLLFKIDKVTAIFTFTVFLVGLAASLYAVDAHPRRNAPSLPPFLAAFIFAIALLGLSANIVTACVCVEIQTFALVLTLLAGEEYSAEAAVKYMYMALLGSAFMAMGLGLTTCSFASLITVGLILYAIGLLLKTGVFPLHAWLPDVDARAHTSVAALSSSVAVAAGLTALSNVLTHYLDILTRSGLCVAVGDALLALAIASIIYGSISAITTADIRRALAYSTIGHMGFALAPYSVGLILLGLKLIPASSLALYIGAMMLYIVVHALGKALLFLAGCVPVDLYGIHEYTGLGGLFRKHRIATWTFLGGALTLSGVPPLPGFIAKLVVILVLTDLALRTASLWYIVALALVVGTAIATPVYSIRRLWHRTFLGTPREQMYPQTPSIFLANAACIILFLALLTLGTIIPFIIPTGLQILIPTSALT